MVPVGAGNKAQTVLGRQRLARERTGTLGDRLIGGASFRVALSCVDTHTRSDRSLDMSGLRLRRGISPGVGGFRSGFFFSGGLWRCDVLCRDPAGFDTGAEDHCLGVLAGDVHAVESALVLGRFARPAPSSVRSSRPESSVAQSARSSSVLMPASPSATNIAVVTPSTPGQLVLTRRARRRRASRSASSFARNSRARVWISTAVALVEALDVGDLGGLDERHFLRRREALGREELRDHLVHVERYP
jgi:hypothetical protein